MLTQQDIYAAGSENRPPMLNKDNYVPWSSRDPDREVHVAKTFHEQTDEELTEKEVNQMEADDQAIQTILMGLPEDISDVVDSCETAQKIWLRVQQMMKGSDIGIQEKKTKLFNEWQIAQPGMNMGQDRQMQMVGGIANQNVNQNGNGNTVAARAEGNGNGNNENQIRCYNCRGMGHLARNCTVKPRRRDVAYLQTQLLIAQKEKARIQLQAEEFDLTAAARDLYEIEEVNANCILMANLQQASTSGTQTDKAHVYDSNGSADVDEYDNWYNNEIFNMSTQEEQYTKLLDPISEPHQKVNSVNRKMKETNVELTTELARYKNQENCFEINQEKYDKLERCYQKSVYQEQCLTKKIIALHLSSVKMITTLNEEIANLNNQLSKEKSTISFLREEKKKLKSNFKICEEELLDKQIQLENKIKELDNILVKTGQSIQMMHMLSPKPDSFYHTEQKMHDPLAVYNSKKTLQLAQESRLKMKQLNKEIKPANYAKVNYLSEVFVSQKDKSREELYFLNTSKMASVSKSISIPNEEFSDDTSPSVARKILNEALEFEIERLLRAVVIQDIMSIVQNPNVVKTSVVQTELDRILKVGESNALSNPVTSNSAPSTQELKVVKNDNVIALGMFRINPS
ncbi:retrovirus-related pol polyprotein from transposon TNT 1-94 [Tanacetum coccineum]